MSKIEKLESLKQENVLLVKRKSKIFQKKNKELTSFFKEFFGELPFHNVGGYDQDSFYFNVIDEVGNEKEIARLTLRKSNWDKVGFDEVHIGYYSTSTHSVFELNRLITIGKLAEFVKANSKAILDNHHLIVSKYNKVESKLNSKIWGLEKDINEVYRSIQEDKADKRKQISLLKKSKGCAKCGYKENPDILHYHHINPDTKIANVSRMVGKNHSMQRIMAEIEKCELLCITCHHKEHGLKND